MKLLIKLLRCKKNPKDKFGLGFKGRKVENGEEVIVHYFCGKLGQLISARTSLKRVTHQRVRLVLTSTHMLTRKKDPKRFGYLRIK